MTVTSGIEAGIKDLLTGFSKKGTQVICVTHLPQIAAMADHQFLVEKRVEGERTNTSVRCLTHVERISEIARMLGGEEESAKVHAREMLKEEGKQS